MPDPPDDHDDTGGWTIAAGIVVLVFLATLLARSQLDPIVVATLVVAPGAAKGR